MRCPQSEAWSSSHQNQKVAFFDNRKWIPLGKWKHASTAGGSVGKTRDNEQQVCVIRVG
ncbi:hypothetical protein Ocin01_01797 [Orchesella cincta]|uniref:Uncharacterized protein n=1 Tax=Orchesella cincta TaxID=48709 RepID=A0A1D2NI46_ORCCI|nr:hypothetical protein Ocin01_01797 [Orchesella cincta]